MEEKFEVGDRVTRSRKCYHYKDFDGLAGTVVEILTYNYRKRYKIKWDKKSGKWIPDMHGKFVADAGQQHSTLQARFLTRVLAA